MNTSRCTDCSNTDSSDQVDRRQLLKQGVLAAVAATLSATVSACARAALPVNTAPTTSTTPLGAWSIRVRPADFPALANVWGIARVDGDSDKPVAVVRTPTGFAAFSLRCPHAGATVEFSGDKFVCPGHGAEFKADGTWTGGHRTTNLTALVATYDVATQILVLTA